MINDENAKKKKHNKNNTLVLRQNMNINAWSELITKHAIIFCKSRWVKNCETVMLWLIRFKDK
jgi:hypothetical protein